MAEHFGPVSVAVSDGVATVTVDKPPVNAMGREVLAGLGGAAERVGPAPEVRAVVLTGTRQAAFMAGADIGEFQALRAEPGAMDRHSQTARAVFDAWQALPQPVIAAVQASAVGGGLEIALLCDLIVADPAARFGLPEVKLGLIPGGGGTQRLPARIGTAAAKELLFLGSLIDAPRAHALGLVPRNVLLRGFHRGLRRLPGEAQARLHPPLGGSCPARCCSGARVPPSAGSAARCARCPAWNSPRSAAGNFRCPAAELSPNAWRTVIDIDLNGTFFCSQAAAAAMRAAGRGVIINITGDFTGTHGDRMAHAAAAKAGIDSLTRSLAKEWGPDGIRLNALAPGPFETAGGAQALGRREAFDEIGARLPVGRIGRLEEIVAAAVFLASDAAAFITGATLVRGLETSDETLAVVLDLARRFGKETIVCKKDTQGFLTSRLIMALVLEAARVVDEGIADADDVNKACVLAFNHAMGPLATVDMGGLDTMERASDAMTHNFGERFRPPQILRTLVNAGHYGRKTGRGFSDYGSAQ